MKANQQKNPLKRWLSLNWERPERSYNPDVRDFWVNLLDYPKDQVVTEDKAGGGYPDFKFLTDEKISWVVGDLKKDDRYLTTAIGRETLWTEKRKYVEGLTRYLVFLTANYLWVILPTGETIEGLEAPIDLSATNLDHLRETLNFLSHEQAKHSRQWEIFLTGEIAYSYLKLDDNATLEQLKKDLRSSFAELNESSDRALKLLFAQYQDYHQQEAEIKRNLVGTGESQRRALIKLKNEFQLARSIFDEILPTFEEQYGREVNTNSNQQAKKKIQEAFISDSVAVLIARVLFLRLLEDLNLVKKRRLSNGGLKDWAEFVENLTGDASALVRLVGEDLGKIYQEPFARNLFDWLYQTHENINPPLQRLILRLNAYDFSGLSEEILGDIYQSFLPPAKRKQLGEFYTPASIVDWLLDQTVFSHEPGRIIDPACGSGSFLVRYVYRCLEDAKQRGLDQNEVLEDLKQTVWGFDLNPFAAFISHFQLTWAFLRYQPKNQPPLIHVHNLNSLLRDDDLIALLGEKSLPKGAIERDTQQWKYILGNPPYIRAERVKYSEEMRGLWKQIWGQNADTGLVFIYRALTESLEKGGFLGMVVSGGYANSEAAAKVWKLLYPNAKASLRKIVWLEFVGKLWEANVIPLLLVIEETPAQDNDEIELYVPSVWVSDEPPVKVKYKDFFDAKINPRVTKIDPSNTTEGNWGDYLLPLLQQKDIPILKKLYPNGQNGKNHNIVELKEAVEQQISRNNRPFWFTYGIQRGGVEVTSEATGENSVEVIRGSSISIAWSGDAEGWVDLDAVKERKYGKLSLWGEQNHEKFIAISELGQSPFASLVQGNHYAAINSVVVALPKSNSPTAEAITAYLNSKLVRYYWLIRLRSGVIQGGRAHIYPRTLEALPWLKNLDSNREKQLTDYYKELARLATVAKNNPDQWLLATVETRITQQPYKLSDRALGLNFSQWTPEAVTPQHLTLNGNRIETDSFYLEVADADLATLVYKLLTLNAEENSSISRKVIQKLLIPQNYPQLMAEYRQRLLHFQQVEADFFAVLDKIDHTVYELFGLSDQETTHIEQRLSSFPLNQLQPRYPWDNVKPKPIKAYTEDRFA